MTGPPTKPEAAAQAPPDLADRVLLLAGAGGGLGRAVAAAVLARGGRVAAAVRRPWQVDKLRQELGRERTLVGVVGAQDGEAAAGFVKGAQDALGAIDAFIGAAGAWQGAGGDPGADLAELLEANLLANATLARAALAWLRRRRRGRLVFVGASEPALAAGSVAFRASMAAVHEYVRALDQDLVGSGLVAGAVLLGHASSPSVGGRERAAAALVARAFDLPAAGGLFAPSG